MSHEKFQEELNALRENLPELAEETSPSKTSDQYYSLDLAKRIIDYSAQGKSLHWISQQSQMPCYSTLLRWAKSHPEFSKLLGSVRTARALHFEEAAIQAAENAMGKDADRLKFEAYKWGAEVNDPGTYGKKVTHSGDTENPIILQVITGFGPPNEWQTPPKLKADGTIDKDYKEPIDVTSTIEEAEKIQPQENGTQDREALNGEGNSSNSEQVNPAADERSPQESGSVVATSSS